MNKNIAKITSENYNFTVDMNSSNDYRDTFFDEMLNEKYYFPNAIRLDLIYISNFIFAADRRIPRKKAEDAWTRKINIVIPVICLNKWENVTELIEKMLSYLTGDLWTIKFTSRYPNDDESRLLMENNTQKLEEPNTQISMFSGGLDSFIGLIDILSDKELKNTLFLSHYGGGSKGTKSYQDILKLNVLKEFNNITDINFFSFHSVALKKLTGEEETTTRSRSFMFFSHAIGLAPDGSKVIIPENGFISLNIPLYASRNGSSSTRTTHPYYMKLFQKLLHEIEIDVLLENPYQFKTKGQMIKECKNRVFLKKNIINTMSCSHPTNSRWEKYSEPIHCGYCLPCTIRRASIKAGFDKDSTVYRYLNYENPVGNEIFNVLKIALFKYENSNHYIDIQKSGSIEYDLYKFVKMYEDGMCELKTLIEEDIL